MQSKYFKKPRVDEDVGAAFCADSPNKYRCRFRSTCGECFESSKQCEHFRENRLKVLLAGNNPSTHVWLHGYAYGNPTNRMWKLLTGELGGIQFRGLLPRDLEIKEQNRLPDKYGIGFADVGLLPGNDASKIPLQPWVESFYARLQRHIDNVHAHEGNTEYKGPACVAFTGKSQFFSLYTKQDLKSIKVDFGLLGEHVPWPSNFPFSREHTKIWILPSSSGRAAMTHEQRITPYRMLAEFVHGVAEEEE